MTSARPRMMKTNISPFLFLGAVLVATVASNAFAQDTKPYASTPLSMEWTIPVFVTVTA